MSKSEAVIAKKKVGPIQRLNTVLDDFVLPYIQETLTIYPVELLGVPLDVAPGLLVELVIRAGCADPVELFVATNRKESPGGQNQLVFTGAIRRT